jgi:diadenosine tetraphosphate (Ap4A) HIT family hydrolase
MALIYETSNFIVESSENPHVDRNDGGHIRILPKQPLHDRTEMSPALAKEFIRLSMVVGEAMQIAMTNQGLTIMRINYHDMGNWAYKLGIPLFFHLHIYARAKEALYQPYQEAVYLPDRSTGFYKNFKPLTEEDVLEVKKQIELIFQQPKYADAEWGI